MIGWILRLIIPIGISVGVTIYIIGLLGQVGLGPEQIMFLQSLMIVDICFIAAALVYTMVYPNKKPIDRPQIANAIIGLGAIGAFMLFVSGILFGILSVIFDVLGWYGLFAYGCPLIVVQAILFLLGALVVSLIYGFFVGKYRYKVEQVDLSFDDLPSAFDGFRIVQISDIHSGTWNDISKVARGVQMIQDQEADMIVFTGDLVNSDKEEINPFIPLFAKLSAKHGKYAILGNHDYYGQPRDSAFRPAYYEDFFMKYDAMGWDLLRNEHRIIRKDGSHLILAGVENWGEGKYFPKRGDLGATLDGVGEEDFCIMLSHDPSHWSHHILEFKKHIALTLSGHTHGMQFGINFSWLRWSPIKWRYKNWIGRYVENGKQLYVNRGFGVLGFSGRVGMWPEITVLTLQKSKM